MHIPQNLLNEHYNDRYFDVVNALEEADLIYFQGNRLVERLSDHCDEQNPFVIGETGFGAGRLLLALLDLLDKSGLTGLSISYYSVELHPLTPDRMRSVLSSFSDQVPELIELLVQAYGTLDVTASGWQRLSLQRDFGCLTLHVWFGEALEMVNALQCCCDAWFLDGHSPKKNPHIWRPELLSAIGEKTVNRGTCATFTVSSSVRAALVQAGFSVQRCPGVVAHKNVLKGEKRVL
ncbi:MAG: tRNA (5-methylaminomethyl-2-thiouridine)(34)-methyltransferase MnmD [Chitinivibrionales bacterium]|nr:tRNA (5-methylaminomethyl-2-thiouridine)(34)-methyltransferase MnmD [Chitinivibrionales bacterium]